MVDKWSCDYGRRMHVRACWCAYACVRARARGGLPHLLVPLVSIGVKELQMKRPRHVHPVSDSLELFGVPRAEVWWPAASATAWSLSTSACRTGSSSCH
jgi:hypothetical protein